MTLNRVTVFGGSGFIGRYVVQRLARRDIVVRVAVRDVEAAQFLKPMGAVGQVAPIETDLRDPASVARALEGADAAVNAVSLYVERGKTTFASVHEDGARAVARAAAEAGLQRLIHISGIGVDPDSPSRYARSRAAGEALVGEAFPDVTMMRPSVVFGPEDAFFNTFGAMARLFWVLPLFGVRRAHDFPFYEAGFTKMQPVYVADIADAIMAALDDNKTKGSVFELGGPGVYTFADLIRLVCAETARKRLLVPVPFWAASIMGAMMSLLPDPPLTRDQVTLLKSDNVVDKKAQGLKDLGVKPTAVETILPTYLQRFRKGGRFGHARLA